MNKIERKMWDIIYRGTEWMFTERGVWRIKLVMFWVVVIAYFTTLLIMIIHDKIKS